MDVFDPPKNVSALSHESSLVPAKKRTSKESVGSEKPVKCYPAVTRL
jgi:hypothetical protein